MSGGRWGDGGKGGLAWVCAKLGLLCGHQMRFSGYLCGSEPKCRPSGMAKSKCNPGAARLQFLLDMLTTRIM